MQVCCPPSSLLGWTARSIPAYLRAKEPGAKMAADTNYRAGIKLLLKSEWSSFFATFARFEYAMKQAGYLKHSKPGTSAEAGWEAFSQDLGTTFFDQCKANPELEVLFVAPPRLLKVDTGNAVSWKKARAVNSVGDFFQVIKDIRNNLFHGEKQVHAERDGQLIAAAQQSLDLAWQAAAQNGANPALVQFCAAFRYH